MTATTTADRRRIIELKLWMEDHDITVKATSEYLGWAFATTRYNLMVASEPKRREKLLALAWGYDYEGETRTVDMHVKALRQKLGEDIITTVRGVGYKMV